MGESSGTTFALYHSHMNTIGTATPKEIRSMKCKKCQGFMVRQEYSDYFFLVIAWKCLNCASIVYPSLAHNQRKHCVARTADSVTR
jgi:RNase P subunit RPR2